MRARWIAVLACLAGCPSPTPNPPVPPGGGSGSAGSGDGSGGGSGQTPSTIPPELAVAAGNQLVLAASAKGVQIYECAPDASGTPAWKLHAPRATLFDAAGNQVAIHFGGVDKGLPPGPYWQASDGSRVHGANPVSVPSPGSIPLLRLDAADTSGNGVFTRVTFIQRLDTSGGVAPAGACQSGMTEVAYTAKYNFYAKP
ncbi:MAG TPA: DUF3455 domain-containing protein [Kofleriaceae bacterium]|jgi:hypothetical protein|nr:DUF3455 domain-containing protein [Kofleriaceae bacterium]